MVGGPLGKAAKNVSVIEPDPLVVAGIEIAPLNPLPTAPNCADDDELPAVTDDCVLAG
jgi:hypothetical protein